MNQEFKKDDIVFVKDSGETWREANYSSYRKRSKYPHGVTFKNSTLGEFVYTQCTSLPEKWAVEVTPENANEINTLRASPVYGTKFGYVTYKPYGTNTWGLWEDEVDLDKDITIISFEAFKQNFIKKQKRSDMKFTVPTTLILKSEEQCNRIKEELDKLGYSGRYGMTVFYGREYKYLITDFGGYNNVYGINQGSKGLVTDNEELFLALAAMNDGEEPIIGEYIIAKDTISHFPKVPEKVYEIRHFDGNKTFNTVSNNNYWESHLRRKCTKEEIMKHLKQQELPNMEDTQTITRENYKKLYEAACTDYKTILLAELEKHDVFSTIIHLPNSFISKLFNAATTHKGIDQEKVLEKYLHRPASEFNSSMLKVGEMMKITDKLSTCVGDIVVRSSSDRLINLNKITDYWANPQFTNIVGEKIPTGTEVSIIAK